MIIVVVRIGCIFADPLGAMAVLASMGGMIVRPGSLTLITCEAYAGVFFVILGRYGYTEGPAGCAFCGGIASLDDFESYICVFARWT